VPLAAPDEVVSECASVVGTVSGYIQVHGLAAAEDHAVGDPAGPPACADDILYDLDCLVGISVAGVGGGGQQAGDLRRPLSGWWSRDSLHALSQPYQAASCRDRAGPAERGDERVACLAGAGEPGDVIAQGR